MLLSCENDLLEKELCRLNLIFKIGFGFKDFSEFGFKFSTYGYCFYTCGIQMTHIHQ